MFFDDAMSPVISQFVKEFSLKKNLKLDNNKTGLRNGKSPRILIRAPGSNVWGPCECHACFLLQHAEEFVLQKKPLYPLP